ncbi:hypothetical protein B0T11DRAFT_83678 [Plectosphaerella cucumerina]|uniref:Uncharacterized protein n=1 Tax=Plectosphaerella cucumerina TaxID=40658 RepID=A0A8K0X3N3_9PEZI|nr:hypothetical protein B0T11DRAFT_83678 [Plectosphaerella cucumerina]
MPRTWVSRQAQCQDASALSTRATQRLWPPSPLSARHGPGGQAWPSSCRLAVFLSRISWYCPGGQASNFDMAFGSPTTSGSSSVCQCRLHNTKETVLTPWALVGPAAGPHEVSCWSCPSSAFRLVFQLVGAWGLLRTGPLRCWAKVGSTGKSQNLGRRAPHPPWTDKRALPVKHSAVRCLFCLPATLIPRDGAPCTTRAAPACHPTFGRQRAVRHPPCSPPPLLRDSQEISFTRPHPSSRGTSHVVRLLPPVDTSHHPSTLGP